jgi:hypothetical protein
MANVSANVRAGVSGKAYYSAVGTTAPTDATTAWGSGWIDLGWVMADKGISESYNDSTKQVRGFQSGATVRTIIQNSDAEFGFTLLESKGSTLTLFHKGSTITTSGGNSTLPVVLPVPQRWAFGFDIIDDPTHILRIIVSQGEVMERKPISYMNADGIYYDIVVMGYPDASGVVATKLSNDTAWTMS